MFKFQMNVVSRYFIHKSGLHCLSSVSTAIIRFNSDITNGRSHVFRSRGYIHCYFNLLQRTPCYNRPSSNLRPNNPHCYNRPSRNRPSRDRMFSQFLEFFSVKFTVLDKRPQKYGLLVTDVRDQQTTAISTVESLHNSQRAKVTNKVEVTRKVIGATVTCLRFSPNFKGRLILPVELADQTSSVVISAQFVWLE